MTKCSWGHQQADNSNILPLQLDLSCGQYISNFCVATHPESFQKGLFMSEGGRSFSGQGSGSGGNRGGCDTISGVIFSTSDGSVDEDPWTISSDRAHGMMSGEAMIVDWVCSVSLPQYISVAVRRKDWTSTPDSESKTLVFLNPVVFEEQFLLPLRRTTKSSAGNVLVDSETQEQSQSMVIAPPNIILGSHQTRLSKNPHQ
ncbi:MAG: hypothetical protein J3Q66DRAFT_365846 [Benniella sp.]|nr:MAG: hypothetical protein J3Q66DRAFT_365846 [Benniella sp.]